MNLDYRRPILVGVLIGLFGALVMLGIYIWLHVPPKTMLLASALMLTLSWIAFAIHLISFVHHTKKLEKELKDFERRKEEMKSSVDQETRNMLEAIEYVYNCTHGGEENDS